MTTLAQKTRIQYVYDFATLERVPEGPTSAQVDAKRLLSGLTLQTGKSSTVAAVITGSRLIVALAGMPPGSGAKAHYHPNEQFNYIVKGVMTGELGGERIFARAGTLMHTPTLEVHTGLACPDEDLVFFAMKDTRHGIVGPPVDGKYDGPNYLPGFGKRADERMKSTAELIAEAGTNPVGVRTRFVYDYEQLEEKPGRVSSAQVTRHVTAGPWTGDLLTGATLQVARLHCPRGSTVPTHAHPSEQFTFVVEGALDAQIDGEELAVGRYSVVHIPAGMPHRLSVPPGQDALIITLQEARHPFAG